MDCKTVFLTMFFLGSVAAAQEEIRLRTFAAGAPARAEDFNENFSALKAAIEGLQRSSSTEGKSLAAVPPGAILAWFPFDGQGRLRPIPAGWDICNGANGTPDLRGRFLMGVSDPAEANKLGGKSSYPTRRARTDDPGNGSDYFVQRHENPNRSGATDIRPPFATVVFIIKRYPDAGQ